MSGQSDKRSVDGTLQRTVGSRWLTRDVRGIEMSSPPNLFGQALSDYYHDDLNEQSLVCSEVREYPLDLSFYLATEPTDQPKNK